MNFNTHNELRPSRASLDNSTKCRAFHISFPLPLLCRHRPPNPAAGLREQELRREGRVHVRVELRRGRRRPPRHLHRQVLLRQLLQVARGRRRRRRRRRRRTKRRQQTAGDHSNNQSFLPARYSLCAIVDIDGENPVRFRVMRLTTKRRWEISPTTRKSVSKLVSYRQRRRPRRRGRPPLPPPLSPPPLLPLLLPQPPQLPP